MKRFFPVFLIAALAILTAEPNRAQNPSGSGTSSALKGSQQATTSPSSGNSSSEHGDMFGNLSGIWVFSTSGSTSSGMCPPGRPSAGKLMITHQGSQIGLKFLTGFVCRPASVCSYSGSLAGNNISLSNSARVDDEGGTVSNRMALVVSSKETIHGNSISIYTHPEGMSCTWESQININRLVDSQNTDNSEETTSSGTDTGTADTESSESANEESSSNQDPGDTSSSGEDTDTSG